MSKLRNNKFVAIIPARQGSKGLKNINIKKFRPPTYFLHNTSGKKFRLYKQVYVSTDGQKIKKISNSMEQKSLIDQAIYLMIPLFLMLPFFMQLVR